MEFKEITQKMLCFSNWNFITSNTGREIELWENKPIYTWNGWENRHEKPKRLLLVSDLYFGGPANAKNFIFERTSEKEKTKYISEE